MAASNSNCPSQRSSKGKAKVEGSNCEDVIPWNWTSLTDPSSGQVPPVFTKDGR